MISALIKDVCPELLKQWDYKRNITDPCQIRINDNDKYYWNYDCGHNAYISTESRYTNFRRKGGLNKSCRDCASKEASKRRRLTHESFIQKLKDLGFEKKYDLSTIKFIGKFKQITPTCRIHGIFSIRALNFRQGIDCPRCRGRIFDYQSFIEMNKQYNDKWQDYEYSEENFDLKNDQRKIKIKHNICGKEFSQNFSTHAYGRTGCPHCAGLNRTWEDFLIASDEIYEEGEYTFFPEEFSLWNSKMKMIHNKCGNEIFKSPRAHIEKRECYHCSRLNTRITQEDFNIRMANHFGEYSNLDWSDSKYITHRDPIEVVCKIHGKITSTPGQLLHGSKLGCSICNTGSQQEIITGLYLSDLLLGKYKILGKFYKDGVVYRKQFFFQFEDRKIYTDYAIFDNDKLICIIEYNGRQHYEPIIWDKLNEEECLHVFHMQNKRDKILKEHCESNGINFIAIDGRKYKFAGIKEFLLQDKFILELTNNIKEI